MSFHTGLLKDGTKEIASGSPSYESSPQNQEPYDGIVLPKEVSVEKKTRPNIVLDEMASRESEKPSKPSTEQN